jgi:hypothetical protein
MNDTATTENREQSAGGHERKTRMVDRDPGRRTSSGPADICSAPTEAGHMTAAEQIVRSAKKFRTLAQPGSLGMETAYLSSRTAGDKAAPQAHRLRFLCRGIARSPFRKTLVAALSKVGGQGWPLRWHRQGLRSPDRTIARDALTPASPSREVAGGAPTRCATFGQLPRHPDRRLGVQVE